MRQEAKPPLARGVLRDEEGRRAFNLRVYEPSPALRPWVEFYWSVDWDLEGRSFAQTVVTNPTIDLSFERDPATHGPVDRVVATGLVPRHYERQLRGRGEVFAAHFHPGMFRPWWGAGVQSLTARAELLGSGARPWEAAALALAPALMDAPDQDRVALLDDFLTTRLPRPDPVGVEIRDLVLAARDDRALWEAEALAARRGVTPRTNQRHFLEYVGIGPAWVIRRYRVQAAIAVLDGERRGEGGKVDLSTLAVELGYFDAAHFSKDFRAMTGWSPDRYRKPAPPP